MLNLTPKAAVLDIDIARIAFAIGSDRLLCRGYVF